MKKAKIFARIDDRLIHGQVMTAWLQTYKTKWIIIVDNDIAEDEYLKSLILMVTPLNVKIDVFNVKEASAGILEKARAESVFLLAKTPKTFFLLENHGIELTEIILGGISAKLGRKQLYKNIFVTDEELEYLKKMKDLGIKIKVQIVPDERGISFESLI